MKSSVRWLLFEYQGRELVILSKPFKTKELAEKARQKYPDRQIAFYEDKVHLRVDSHFVDHAVNYFKEYCKTANEEYTHRVIKEHADGLALERARLQQSIEMKEAKLKLLNRITL